jgi:hypothetical protein
MTTTELLAIFRQEVFDTAAPYLWADSLIYTYIDEAQKQFCRDTYGIEDARSFTIVTKTDGTVWYAIDPQILKIRDAVLTSTGADVPLIAVEKMRDNNMKFDGAVGSIRAFVTGMEKGYLRAYPIPNTVATVELRTFRLPNDVASGDDFEIDPQHHLPLLYWAKHKAYSVQDTDTFDVKKAKEFEDKFATYCAKAKVEQSRVRRPVSVVAYGGY